VFYFSIFDFRSFISLKTFLSFDFCSFISLPHSVPKCPLGLVQGKENFSLLNFWFDFSLGQVPKGTLAQNAVIFLFLTLLFNFES
jgi:hypothetical protein